VEFEAGGLVAETSLLVFRLADQRLAIAADAVRRILPLPRLATPPLLPPALAGYMDLGGTAIAVVRLDRLLALPEEALHLYSPLLLLKEGAVALAVHAVSTTCATGPDTWLPVADTRSFNGCVAAEARSPEGMVHVLSPGRVLAEEERQGIAALQAQAQQRLRDLREPPA
jgi:purine-binding chemotaxis protein CheW